MRRLAALVVLTLLLPACTDDPAAPGEILPNYLALGSTMAAGGASGGLTATSQQQGYPVILGTRLSAPFMLPLVTDPGCPAPYTAPLVPATSAACAGRQAPSLVPHDLAVPGTRVADALIVPAGATGTLHTLLVGAKSQLATMQALRPFMVSVQLGDDDALRATLQGTLGPVSPGTDSLLTPLAAFNASYTQVAAALKATPTLVRVVLVGVTDPVITVPALQPGAYFFLARDAAGKFNGKPVNANCSPVTALGQPNPLAANRVNFAIVGDAGFPEINCDPAAYPAGDPRRGTWLLDTDEQAVVRARVAAYNAAIQAIATTNNWAYVDPNAAFAPLIATRASGRTDNLRMCLDVATAGTAAQFQSAILNTCPVTGATGAANYFGALSTLDGVMLSASAQTALTNAIAVALNTRYGTTIPTS